MHRFEELLGKVCTSVININDSELVFTLESGEKYKFYHEQDCCEYVTIDDICGDLEELVGSPLLVAEEVHGEVPVIQDRSDDRYYDESITWTFYRFATQKGWVTVRWYGTSNGYYSESVDFVRVKD